MLWVLRYRHANSAWFPKRYSGLPGLARLRRCDSGGCRGRGREGGLGGCLLGLDDPASFAAHERLAQTRQALAGRLRDDLVNVRGARVLDLLVRDVAGEDQRQRVSTLVDLLLALACDRRGALLLGGRLGGRGSGNGRGRRHDGCGGVLGGGIVALVLAHFFCISLLLTFLLTNLIDKYDYGNFFGLKQDLFPIIFKVDRCTRSADSG